MNEIFKKNYKKKARGTRKWKKYLIIVIKTWEQIFVYFGFSGYFLIFWWLERLPCHFILWIGKLVSFSFGRVILHIFSNFIYLSPYQSRVYFCFFVCFFQWWISLRLFSCPSLIHNRVVSIINLISTDNWKKGPDMLS